MKRSIVFLAHIALWLLLYAITFFISDTFLSLSRPAYGVIPTQVPYSVALYILALIAVPFYIFYFLFFKLTKNKNRVYWFLLALALLMILPAIFLKLDDQVISTGNYTASFLFFLFFALLGVLCSSFFRWMEQSHLRVNQEKQQLISELAMLRLQLNPHFLFNTLHNIDALIKREPDTASSLLIRLSAMMRYMLYESQDHKVLLQQEIDYIHNYISLQKLRYPDENSIKFKQVGGPDNISVAPMLLIPFIENAFKHHRNESTADEINIELNITQNQIYLYCSNNYQPRDIHKDTASGIGLSTIKRRLALIYPGQHNLLIADKDNIFVVRLTIDINEN
jgi:two-component system, LytTR family, sensor kinase